MRCSIELETAVPLSMFLIIVLICIVIFMQPTTNNKAHYECSDGYISPSSTYNRIHSRTGMLHSGYQNVVYNIPSGVSCQLIRE